MIEHCNIPQASAASEIRLYPMIARLEKLIGLLPPHQRELATKKIQQATALGWHEDAIRLTTPDGATPHHCELMGIHPISLKPTLLPEPE